MIKNNIKYFLLQVVLLFFSSLSPAQSFSQNNFNYQEKYRLKIARTNEVIKIDGELSETTWEAADVATDFWQTINRDNNAPTHQTQIRLTYNDEFIFVAIKCYDTVPYINATLKRDTRPNNSDVMALMFDPVNQHASAFIFCVSAYNVQYEDMYSTSNIINWTWDNKWLSATKRYNDRWTSEMAIPFKSIRYAEGKTEWGLNFIRSDQKNAEWSMWTKVPLNIDWKDLGYFGTLEWDVAPPLPGKNISFIPYVSGSIEKDNERNKSSASKINSGFDAKIAVSSNMNLDLTLNPDFSQIEVDQQVTNLTRFNIFFPEKRTFFLENSDLYADLGYESIRPFYSRTIGLDADGNAIPIIGGARLSGNVNKKLRIGLMNIQTLKKNEFAAQNYTAIVLKQRVLKRSGINAYFLNRQSFLTDSQKIKNPINQYSRNAGIEAQLTSNTGKWKTFSGLHFSLKPGINNKNIFINTGAEYSTRKVGVKLHYNSVGTNYYTDMGFAGRIYNYDAFLDTVSRLGYKQLFTKTEYKAIPVKGNIDSHLWGTENSIYFNPDGSLSEQQNKLSYQISFKNSSKLTTQLEHSDTRLLFYTRFTDNPLPPDSYLYNRYSLQYQSDTRKDIGITAAISNGGFYNGKLFSTNTEVRFRRQPWGNFSLLLNYNKLHFPQFYGNGELFLISSKTEIGFSTNIFWTTYFQYNTQQNNFNINSRFQWRFKPMSDFFIVYTDNYFANPFLKDRTRALIFKLNYWFNL